MRKYFLDTSFIMNLINEEDEAIRIHEEIKGNEVTDTPCLYELLDKWQTSILFRQDP